MRPEVGARAGGRLGPKGWVYAGKYSFERYLYTLHRVTGVGLVLYLLLHIYETGLRLRGEVPWEGLMRLFTAPVFKVGEFLVFAGFAFHALNGIRLLLTEFGFFLGRPSQPIYPYSTSVRRHRPLSYVLMFAAAVFIVLGGFGIFS